MKRVLAAVMSLALGFAVVPSHAEHLVTHTLLAPGIAWGAEIDPNININPYSTFTAWLPDSSAVLRTTFDPQDVWGCNQQVTAVSVSAPFAETPFMTGCFMKDNIYLKRNIAVHPTLPRIAFTECTTSCLMAGVFIKYDESELKSRITPPGLHVNNIAWIGEDTLVFSATEEIDHTHVPYIVNTTTLAIRVLPAPRLLTEPFIFGDADYARGKALFMRWSGGGTRIYEYDLATDSFEDLGIHAAVPRGAVIEPTVASYFGSDGVQVSVLAGEDEATPMLYTRSTGLATPLYPNVINGRVGYSSPDRSMVAYESRYLDREDPYGLWLVSLSGKKFSALPARGVNINAKAPYTRSRNVTVSFFPPAATSQALISENSNFTNAQTVMFESTGFREKESVAFELKQNQKSVRTVYMKFLPEGQIYSDSITLDNVKPKVARVSVLKASSNKGTLIGTSKDTQGYVLNTTVKDTIGTVARLEVKTSTSQAKSMKYGAKVWIRTDKKSKAIQIRACDQAGNCSAWVRRALP